MADCDVAVVGVILVVVSAAAKHCSSSLCLQDALIWRYPCSDLFGVDEHNDIYVASHKGVRT